jgi:hypothetical protein
MPRRSPDHRGLAVLRAAETTEPFDATHPYERGLHTLVTEGVVIQEDVADAYDLYVVPEQRHVVNALLLAKATDTQIELALDLPGLVLPAYRHLFFDRHVFRHALDVGAWVRALPQGPRELYVLAIERGPEALADMFRIGERALPDPKKILRHVLADQYTRFQEHRGQELTSTVAQAALKTGRDAVKTALLLITQSKDAAEAQKAEIQALFELKTEDHTATPEQDGLVLADIVGR